MSATVSPTWQETYLSEAPPTQDLANRIADYVPIKLLRCEKILEELWREKQTLASQVCEW